MVRALQDGPQGQLDSRDQMRSTLVQFLVPLFDPDGTRVSEREFEKMRLELAERFGGVTAFVQSPALGAWKEGGGNTVEEDRMILVEVVAQDFDRAWWTSYRERLEGIFRQEEIMMRSMEIDRI